MNNHRSKLNPKVQVWQLILLSDKLELKLKPKPKNKKDLNQQYSKKFKTKRRTKRRKTRTKIKLKMTVTLMTIWPSLIKQSHKHRHVELSSVLMQLVEFNTAIADSVANATAACISLHMLTTVMNWQTGLILIQWGKEANTAKVLVT